MSTPFLSVCAACGNEHRPRLYDIRRLKCITCGCVNNVVSSLNDEIAEHVRSLGFDCVQEHKVNGRSFDLFVPKANLIVEMQGIRWHSKEGSAKRDMDKYMIAKSLGFRTLWIYEDEWKDRRPAIEGILANKLGMKPAKPVRPKECSIGPVSKKEANCLYDKFHYMGKCASRFSYGAFLNNELVAAMSFRKPSRQSQYDYEICRMVSDPSIRVHGVWSKIMTEFCKDNPEASVVSYSDNRLFSGESYLKMGFRLDGQVKPDYYWVKNGKRRHKSAMRKPVGHHTTETELRESQGYRKIWDLGKKRWVFSQLCGCLR